MENTQMLLLAKLPGLEAAKRLIEAQIQQIQQELTKRPSSTGPERHDPDILGFDSLGRIKRKRYLSPETKAAKRTLIAQAREKRMDKLKKAATEAGSK